MARAGLSGVDVSALGITNHRETTLSSGPEKRASRSLRDRSSMASMGESSQQEASPGHRDHGGGDGEAWFGVSPQASPPGTPPKVRAPPLGGAQACSRVRRLADAPGCKDDVAEGGLSQEGGLVLSPGGAQRSRLPPAVCARRAAGPGGQSRPPADGRALCPPRARSRLPALTGMGRNRLTRTNRPPHSYPGGPGGQACGRRPRRPPRAACHGGRSDPRAGPRPACGPAAPAAATTAPIRTPSSAGRALG